MESLSFIRLFFDMEVRNHCNGICRRSGAGGENGGAREGRGWGFRLVILLMSGGLVVGGVLAEAFGRGEGDAPTPSAQGVQANRGLVIFPAEAGGEEWWRIFGHAAEPSGLREALLGHAEKLRQQGAGEEVLVAEGVGVVMGLSEEASRLPEVQRLLSLQRAAQLQGRGGWTRGERLMVYLMQHLPAEAWRTLKPVVAATETEALKNAAGKRVVVRGVVERVGRSPSGHLVFLNFAGTGRGGFVTVVPRQAAQMFLREDAGFFEKLRGREIDVMGRVEMYQDTPQIVVRSTAQLSVEGQLVKGGAERDEE